MVAYFSLFGASFLAATIFPASSELVLAALLSSGYDAFWLWLVATCGNTLGASVNWWLGTYINRFRNKLWFPVSEPQLIQAQNSFNRYGIWCLLFTWVPIVGDALTVIAGILRVPFILFITLTAIGKAARYALLIGAVDCINAYFSGLPSLCVQIP